MRKQLYVSLGCRGIWEEAESAAEADGVSLSDFTASALREHLNRRKRRMRSAQNQEAE
jgi:hypothetical protein